MPFRQGSVSYSRFKIEGEFPSQPDDSAFAKFAKHVVKPGSLTAEGCASGWCTGHHVFDTDFNWECCGFPGVLLCAMRMDVARVPAEIRRAYVAMAREETRSADTGADKGAGKGAGKGSRGAARKDAREEADRRCATEIKEGKYRRITMSPVLLDLTQGTMLAPVASEAAFTELRALMRETFGARLSRRFAGAVAADILRARGAASELDDALPDAFTPPPAEALARANDDGTPAKAGSRPDVPWALAGGDASDFLGNVFLLWLWWHAEAREGVVELKDSPVAIVIDRIIELECAWGANGHSSFRGALPSRSPEVTKALQMGKWPRKLGLLVSAHGQEHELTLQGDRFQVTGLTLGPASEGANSPRLELEERLDRIATFDSILISLYDAFLRDRFSRGWPARRKQISDWIASRGTARVAVQAATDAPQLAPA